MVTEMNLLHNLLNSLSNSLVKLYLFCSYILWNTFSFLIIEPVPAPVNLRITDVTTNSFRGTWDHGAPDVSLYRITWGHYGRPEKQEVRIDSHHKIL